MRSGRPLGSGDTPVEASRRGGRSVLVEIEDGELIPEGRGRRGNCPEDHLSASLVAMVMDRLKFKALFNDTCE